MKDPGIAFGLLGVGLAMMVMAPTPASEWWAGRPGTPTDWSSAWNVAWLSLAMAGALLLAAPVPRRGERFAASWHVTVGCWPRLLVGLGLIAGVAVSGSGGPAGDQLLAAASGVVGLVACAAAFATAARHGRDWTLMVLVVIAALFGIALAMPAVPC